MRIEEKTLIKELHLYSVKFICEYKNQNDEVVVGRSCRFIAIQNEHGLGVADLALKSHIQQKILRDEDEVVLGKIIKILTISRIDLMGTVFIENNLLTEEAVKAGKEHHES